MICPECKFDNIAGVDQCQNCGHDLTHPQLPHAPEFMAHRLADIPAHAPVRVETTDPVGLAVRYMQKGDADCVLVMSGSQLALDATCCDRPVQRLRARIHQRFERCLDRRDRERDETVGQAIHLEDAGEERQHLQGLQRAEGARQIHVQPVPGRILDEGIVLIGHHVLAFNVLVDRILREVIAGPSVLLITKDLKDLAPPDQRGHTAIVRPVIL